MAFLTPGQVSNIPKKPLTIPTEWTRPGDWISITDNANKIQMLVSDIGTQSFAGTGATTSYSLFTSFTRTGATYSVYIDWGDGSSDQVSTTANTTTNHNYTTGGTPCSRGYNTWVITITVDPTVALSNCSLTAPVNLGTPTYFPSGLLELHHGDTIASGVNLSNRYGSANTITGNYPNLEYVKLPDNWTGAFGARDLSYSFYGCTSLQRVIMPRTMNSCGSMALCFQNCTSLQTITMPESATSLTNLGNTFANCSSLYLITFPSNLTLDPVTNMGNTFLNCSSLDNVTIPSTTSCTSYSAAFSGCYNLTNVKLTSIFTGSGTLTWTNAFLNCSSLVRADIPTTSTSATWTCATMFSGCGSLAYFSFPSSLSISSLSGTFGNCDSIVRIDMPTTTSGSFTMASVFSGCSNLSYMTMPTGGSPSSINSAFLNCSSLTSVVFGTTNVAISDMTSAFSGCHNIETITFTSTAANGVTTMAFCFLNCYKLTSLTLPTSFNSVTAINDAFRNCYSLTTITLPSSMPALTGSGLQNTFNGCSELTTLTLPTTVNTNGITNMTSCFSGCNSLTSITLPTLGTGLNNLSSTFQDTWSLRTLTFSGTLSNNNINATNMLSFSSINTLSISAFTNASLINGTSFGTRSPFCATYSFAARFSKLDISGTVTNPNTFVRTLRLPAVALTGQWGGSSPQINISYTGITYANLVSLFNDMAAQGNVTSKTINITGATGAASLTAGDRLIITSKGWTITG